MARPLRTCPVWIGYLLASPLRALILNPTKLLAPFATPGMRALDVGSAMGFFSLPLARLVGPSGKVIYVDVQAKMLDALWRRAGRAGLQDRIEARPCTADSLNIGDLAATIDLALAIAVAHETGDAARFFTEIRGALKAGGRVFFAEPAGHVSERAFKESLAAAEASGLKEVAELRIRRSRAAVLGPVP